MSAFDIVVTIAIGTLISSTALPTNASLLDGAAVSPSTPSRRAVDVLAQVAAAGGPGSGRTAAVEGVNVETGAGRTSARLVTAGWG